MPDGRDLRPENTPQPPFRLLTSPCLMHLPARHLPPGAATRHLKLTRHFCTFAQEHRSDLHICTPTTTPLPTCPLANSPPRGDSRRMSTPSGSAPLPERLVSLDAFRGLTMLFMASSGFGIAQIAKAYPDSAFWELLRYNTSHAAWIGGGAWDMIQPAFMFMVGMALPFSSSRRAADGQDDRRRFLHTLWRAFVLVALGVFLSTSAGSRPNFIFTNVLAQIGLGYVFLTLLVGRGWKVQAGAIGVITVATWTAFVLTPAAGPGTDFKALGVTEAGQTLDGLWAHWNMNANFAAAFDQWFLNLFPREKAFVFNNGGYQTLNFVPALITMILGLMAGENLRSGKTSGEKLNWLLKAGALCLVLALVT
ncbi:MAG: DUF1624 domain-containing protein, partial [Verrucomicrobia bacterium]|nr:DUF1624 domain-containing protein [Verrucomicrobiota bacterium]